MAAVKEITVAAKRRELLRLQGTPSMVTPAEYAEAKAHGQYLYRRGMSLEQICGGNMHAASLGKILNHPGQTTMRRGTYNALMATRWVAPDHAHREGSRIDGTGARRRMQALTAQGFTCVALGRLLGISQAAAHKLTVRETDMHATTVARIADLYARLELADPLDHGVDAVRCARLKAKSARKGWAPSVCWDPDTIDDPEAFPEWTGMCGTRAGYAMHREERIAVEIKADGKMWVKCKPCVAARKKGYDRYNIAGIRDQATALLETGRDVPYIAEVTGLCERTIYRIRAGITH